MVLVVRGRFEGTERAENIKFFEMAKPTIPKHENENEKQKSVSLAVSFPSFLFVAV